MVAELLRQAEAAELLRFATAGSVDDGKSTLIGRLLHDSRALYEDQLVALDLASRRSGQDELDLALVTDGLRAEREQKITIDVAYRHFATPRRRFIIADTPGHEQYTRNMVTGASTADLAVVLVDVTGGLREQSRRHAYLSWLLGIRQLVVAVNKMDAVAYAEAEFRRVCEAFRAVTAALPGAEVTFIPVSALRGDNVVQRGERMPWYTGPALLEFLETVPLPLTADQPWRFPVQHVLRPSAEFRGYAGTIASGAVAVGDEVAALPGGMTTTVSAILGPAGELEAAAAPMAVTLRLADDLDLGRGHVLCDPARPAWELTELEATLVWMDETPLDVHRTYLVKHTTNLVRGRCVEVTGRLDLETLERIPARGLSLNDIGRVRMKLLKPILADPYRDHRATGSFILIDPDSHQTVAAGMVEERLEATGGKVSGNVTRHSGRVSTAQRAELLRQRPVTLWLTGLSGAGKSSVAYAVEERLIRSGHAAVVLDGDNLRHGLNRDLGFAPHDRSENIRRVAEVARLFNDAGLVVLTAFISPYAADREQARGIIGGERFVEVFVDAPLEVCEGRDPKGLYAKARAGQLPEFTGVSAPYEPPAAADLVLDTARQSVGEVVEQVWRALAERGVLADLEGES